jgi:acyl CoA:acetate/3-ketoacid CoA transferase alpha subunit
VSNNAGAGEDGGLSPLIRTGQVSSCIISYLGNNKNLEKKYLSGKIAIELCPQGTLAEKLRAGGAGIPAFYTPTGARTYYLMESFGDGYMLTSGSRYLYSERGHPNSIGSSRRRLL